MSALSSTLGFGFLVASSFAATSVAAQEANQTLQKSFDIVAAPYVVMKGIDEARIRVGGPPRLIISERKGRFDRLDVSSSKKKLVIENEGGGFFSSRDYSVELQVPSLTALDVAGSLDAEVTGIDSESFEVDAAGSVDMRLAGTCGEFSLDVAGSVDIEAAGLRCRVVNVDAAGSADATVYASQSLSVDGAGSSDVRYLGSPKKVDFDLAGAGSVKAIEPESDSEAL